METFDQSYMAVYHDGATTPMVVCFYLHYSRPQATFRVESWNQVLQIKDALNPDRFYVKVFQGQMPDDWRSQEVAQ